MCVSNVVKLTMCLEEAKILGKLLPEEFLPAQLCPR